MTYFGGRRGKLTPQERERRIVEAWQERPPKRRRPDDVLVFYSWLLEHEPDLVPHGPGSVGRLNQLLEPHIVEPTP